MPQSPHFSIPQFRPVFDKADSEAVAKVVESGWVSEGKLTKEFEERVAKVMGYRFGVATNNGTVALSLALMASNVRIGETVYIPDLTFIATANAAKMIGADVRFADVDKESFCTEFIDVSVNLNGRKVETHTIVDAAQALGSKIGNLAKVATLSFAPNKIITTAQGGMVLTDDSEIAEKVRRLKDHGRLDKADFHPSVGFDFKFSDLQAALGLSQLDKLPARIVHKRRICAQYQEELKGVKGLTVCGAKKGELLWNQDVLVDGGYGSLGMTGRDYLLGKLAEEGIGTRAFYAPLHTQPAYKTSEHFPVAEKISAMGLWLPSSSDLKEEEVSFVCESIRKCLR